MTKEKTMHNQKTFDFEAKPVAKEPEHIETTTSLPPPTQPILLDSQPIEPDTVCVPEPYTFAEFKEFWKRGLTHDSFGDYQSAFERIVAGKDALLSELQATYKAPELKALAARMGDWNAKSNTKLANATSVFEKMLGAYSLDSMTSYSMGETYEEAIKRKVRAVTKQDWDAHQEDKARKQAESEEQLANPQNLADFATFVRTKGQDALSNKQMASWDAQHADLARQRRADNGPSKTVSQFESDELEGVEFHITEGYHTKRECKLWIVVIDQRVDSATFKELNGKAKMLGGRYSNYRGSPDPAGFQFFDVETANRFIALLGGDENREDILQARKDRKELSASERLHELATSMTARAEETIEASEASLQNTARRADIQAGVRGRAYADLALARTLHSLGEALSTKDAKYLDGVRQKVQVETLDTILHLAKWARIRAIQKAETDTEYGYGLRVQEEEEKPYSEDDIRFAEYPTPFVYRSNLAQAIDHCHDKRGVKQTAAKLAKRIKGRTSDSVVFTGEHDIGLLRDFLSRAKSTGFDTRWLDASLEPYTRLKRAHIDGIHELRAALREYLPHKASVRGDDPVKVAERELIGKELLGFFPTPRSIIEQMLDHALIDAHSTVLEPSCGKGDIVHMIAASHPNARITAIEQNRSLAEVLGAKGIDAQFGDFLKHRESYDRIVMNPPFEKGRDIDHVRHAYELLAPGGRLVSVVSEGPFFRSDSKAVGFREWLSDVSGESYPLPDGAFSGNDSFRQTSVNTRLLVLDK